MNFLAACIYFFCNYEKEPYDSHGKKLLAEKVEDKATKRMVPTGRVFDADGNEVEPAYWLGKYSDMPHILSFLNESYQTIFEVLETDNEVAPLLGPFQKRTPNEHETYPVPPCRPVPARHTYGKGTDAPPSPAVGDIRAIPV